MGHTHNIVGHGYGIQREVRATNRVSTSIGGRTPMSANLGRTGAEMVQSDLNRRSALMPDNWADLSPAQLMARRERLLNPTPAKIAVRRPTTTRRVDPATVRANLVATWVERVRAAQFPERFIVTDVPVGIRTDVVRACAGL